MTTTTAGKARDQARSTRSSGSVRIWYAVAVAAFTSSLTPAFGSRLAEGGTSTGGSPASVLILIGLAVFGLFSGVVGPLILDVLLLLSARVAGADVRFREASLLVDKAAVAVAVMVVTSGVTSWIMYDGSVRGGPPLAELLLVTLGAVMSWWLFAVIGMSLTALARSRVVAAVAAGVLLVGGTALASLSERDDLVGSVFAWLPLGLTGRVVNAGAVADLGAYLPPLAALAVSVFITAAVTVRVMSTQNLR